MTTFAIPQNLSVLASMRLVWRLSLPLMISAMSISLMQFSNRLILARYDIEILNIATLIWISVGVFHYSMFAIASITEVFVGQSYGAKQYDSIGPLVWQMIWVTLALSLVGIPAFLGLESYIMPGVMSAEASRAYFWSPFSGCLQGISAAIIGFFVGRGQVRVVTVVALLVNAINIVLAIPLVHGVSGWFQGFGLVGTMWASLVAQALQLIIFMMFFLKKTHRRDYATHRAVFRWSLAKLEVSKAIPAALSHFFEIVAWALLFRKMAACGHQHWTILSMTQGIWFLFSFAFDGLRQGVIAVSANALGAKVTQAIPRLLTGGMLVVLTIVACLAVPLVFWPSLVVNTFFPSGHEISSLMTANMLWLWLFILGDGAVWVLAGFLTGAGDTRWVMISNMISVTFFCLLPVYALIMTGWLQANAWALWLPSAFYGFGNAALMAWRYQSGAWKTINLVSGVQAAQRG